MGKRSIVEAHGSMGHGALRTGSSTLRALSIAIILLSAVCDARTIIRSPKQKNDNKEP